MPIINGKGESGETETKQRHYAGFLNIQMTAAKKVMAEPQYSRWCNQDYYQHFDLYAGDGVWGGGQRGSPLIFLDAVERHDMPYRAVFIDREPGNIARLRERVPRYHRRFCTFLEDDNIMAMRPWLRVTKEKPRMGLFYADPNGVVAWDLLTMLSRMRRYERTDILAYLSANRGLKIHRRCFPDRHKFLTEYLNDIDKKQWLIREPSTKFEWTFVYGTQWANPPEWKRAGFYNIKSREGRRILFRLNFTKGERDDINQPSLFQL